MLIGAHGRNQEQSPKWCQTCGRVQIDKEERYCSEECSQYLDFDNIPDDWFILIDEETEC